jgi:valyl-tRNA synthetase
MGLDRIVKLLHPVTPFITEELWQSLKKEDEDLLIVQEFPTFREDHVFNTDQEDMEKFIEITTAIRNLRNTVNIKPKEEVEIRLFTDDEHVARYLYKSRGFFKELANVKAGKIKDKSIDRPLKSVMKATTHTEVFIPLEGVIDLNDYIQKLERDLKKVQDEHVKVDKKLKNAKFIENAPDEVVAEVKEKASGFNEQIKSLESTLSSLR